jgi:prolyl-tRNA editing enzyme YbaK/EbsC (Cys-tRNA(Pro) deacylase)
MADILSPSVQRVRDALQTLGFGRDIVRLPASAHTSAEAARQLGCEVAQIAKSLVFRARTSGRAVLVIASGANRVDERKITTLVAEPVGKADAAFVRERTGFAIGGVAPVGHAGPVTTFIDEDLAQWPEIWAAGGHPSTVFRLTVDELVGMTGGRVTVVK